MTTTEIAEARLPAVIADNDIVFRSISTLMIFRTGILVFSQPGALAAPQPDQLIDAVRALDMDSVRGEVANQEAQVVR